VPRQKTKGTRTRPSRNHGRSKRALNNSGSRAASGYANPTSKTTTVKPSKVAARTVRWERGEGTGSDQRMLGRPARVVLVFRAAMATPSAPRRARGRNGVQPLAPWLVAKLTAEQNWSA